MSATVNAKGCGFEEERPTVDPTQAAADERKAVEDAIRSEADASASGSGPGAAAGGPDGPGGPAGGGSAAGGRPPFDRVAAKERLEKTPPDSMLTEKEPRSCIFSELELELLRTDIPRLKKAKAAERKAQLERFEAVDLVDLQAKKDVLLDRKRKWVARAVEREEEAYRKGAAQAAADEAEAVKAAFLAKVTGKEPWEKLNGLLAYGRAAGKLGPWSAELETTSTDLETLGPPTKLVIAKHADAILSASSYVPVELLFLGAVVIVFLPRAIDAYSRYQQEREEKAKGKPELGPRPSVN